MTSKLKYLLVFIILQMVLPAQADTYRFIVNKARGLQEKCNYEGSVESSRIKLFSNVIQSSGEIDSLRLSIKVCTSFGFISYKPRVAFPWELLVTLDYGAEFGSLNYEFPSSIMTSIDDQKSTSVEVVNLGIHGSRFDGVKLPAGKHWVSLEWQHRGRTTFGPILIGLSSKAPFRGYRRNVHLPISNILLKIRGRWVQAYLNRFSAN